MKSKETNSTMDQMLEHALLTQKKPEDRLHQKVLRQWRENEGMKQTKKQYKMAAAAACVVAVSAVSVGAAVHFHSAGEVASEMGYQTVAELFESENAIAIGQTQEGGDYTFTVLGIAEGDDLLKAEFEDGNIQGEHFYAVVAIARKDGADLMLDEFDREQKYFISPLIQGLNPVQYNINTMDGAYSQSEIDGVVYRLIDCDAISYFADRTIYLCIVDSGLYDMNACIYDEETGDISRNEDYDGINLLFELPFDSSYADPEKAADYLEEMKKDGDGSEEDSETGLAMEEEMEQWVFEIRHARILAIMDALESDPKDLEEVVSDMELVDEQTEEAVDGRYTFQMKQLGISSESSSERWYDLEDFTDDIAWRWGMESGGSEQRENVEIVRINEDGTATWFRYIKAYTKSFE